MNATATITCLVVLLSVAWAKSVKKRQAVDWYDPVIMGEMIAAMFKGEIPFPQYDPNNLPDTSFQCSDQERSGYYADTELECQVVWQCDLENGQQGYHVCPNMTVWSQEFYTCMWAPVVDCARAPEFYRLNENLYIGPDIDVWGNPVPNQAIVDLSKKK